MSNASIRRNTLLVVLFICSSLFMNAFYKSLSGFIANNFNDPIIMVTMLITYIVPVFCFLFYFYNYYVKKLNKIVNTIYSSVVIILSIISLILIFLNFNVYATNNALGVYGSIPSIIVCFPYDGIIISSFLILVQIYNLTVIIKPNHKFSYLKENHYNIGFVKLSLIEYLLISVLAILALFTVGDFISGFNAIENILYDGKYLYLLLWVLIIPTVNLLSFVFKFENKIKSNSNKVIYLSSLIFVNILFGLLLFIFETISPSFIVSIGKPLFPIAFSISFPVEMIILLAIEAVSIIINSVKLTHYLVKNK